MKTNTNSLNSLSTISGDVQLVKNGINIKTAQILARHSDSRLTLGVYSHVELIDQAKALKNLPTLQYSPSSEQQKSIAIGTNGEKASAVRLLYLTRHVTLTQWKIIQKKEIRL